METGTLKELNVQPGDVVEYVPSGRTATIKGFKGGRWYSECGPSNWPLVEERAFRIVSRATPADDLRARARYMVNNPSAWDHFDQSASDIIRELIAALSHPAPTDSMAADNAIRNLRSHGDQIADLLRQRDRGEL